MTIKESTSGLLRLLPDQIPMDRVAPRLHLLGEQAGLMLPVPQSGSGYLQWILPGKGWVSYADADPIQKEQLARLFQQRRKKIEAQMGDSPLKDIVFRIPDEKYLFFRPGGDGTMEMGLAAWGYRFPTKPATGDIGVDLSPEVKKQEVSIGFMWNGALLPFFEFRLENLPRLTGPDGLFRLDGAVPVGSAYTVKSCREDSVIVEEGKYDYLFDLTQYADVHIRVTHDDLPFPDKKCDLSFGEFQTQLTTGPDGTVSFRLPLVYGDKGLALDPQPECVIRVDDQEQAAVPVPDDGLDFRFAFQTPAPVSVELEQTGDVVIRLLDYDGTPIPDQPFILKTKKKGNVSLQTDAEGKCLVSPDWFTDKEKVKLRFEYARPRGKKK